MHKSLNKYLVDHGLATPDQISEALDYQKIYGDRLESHLFRFGYVNEADLVDALAQQFDFPGAVLSNLEISETALEIIPASFAYNNLVLPYAIDESSQTIKIACDNPGRSFLADNLKAIIDDYKIELHVALDPVLRAAIVKHYRYEPSTIIGEKLPAAPVARTAELDNSLSVRDNSAARPESTNKLDSSCQLLILDNDHDTIATLIPVLRYQGYNLTVEPSVAGFTQANSAMRPEIMLLATTGNHATVVDLVNQLEDRGIVLNECPAFMITSELTQKENSNLLVRGFEDVVRSEYILDLLMIKIRLVRERLVAERHKRQELLYGLGTHGCLEDMSVIDLLQAMGTTGKNIQIDVSGGGHQLSIFMAKGRIIFAASDGKVGAEAVYEAIGWTQGIWSVDPVSLENMPEPNNQLTNEAILLEGCRRLDEKSRKLQEQATADPATILDSFDQPTADHL